MAAITESRNVSGFTEIALQGYGEVVIEQNPDAPESLVIEAFQGYRVSGECKQECIQR